MVYNAGQWKLIIVIYALGSVREKFYVWNEVAPQWKFSCGPLDLNSWVDLFMYVIEGIKLGTWKVRRLNWAYNKVALICNTTLKKRALSTNIFPKAKENGTIQGGDKRIDCSIDIIMQTYIEL